MSFLTPSSEKTYRPRGFRNRYIIETVKYLLSDCESLNQQLITIRAVLRKNSNFTCSFNIVKNNSISSVIEEFFSIEKLLNKFSKTLEDR